MNDKKYYAAAISAFVIWGFFPLLLRALQEYSAGEILYFRILFSLAVLFFIIFGFKRKDLKENWDFLKAFTSEKRNTVIGLTLLGGVLLTVNWLTFIYIVNNTIIHIITTITSFNPT